VSEGWIKVHRQLLNHPKFSDGDWLKVWMFLLCSVTHSPLDRMFSGNRISLKPGQLLTSRKSISASVSVQESKVERILKHLKSEQQIELQSDNRSRLITVCNWGAFQKNEQQDELPVNSNRTTGEQQVNTHKNERMKEGQNHKDVESSQAAPVGYSELFENFWRDCPVKIGKKKAFAQWKIALTKEKVPLQKIMEAVPNYAAKEERRSKLSGYQKHHPAQWLKDARWDDEPETPTPANEEKRPKIG
jgi:hypothetical protein